MRRVCLSPQICCAIDRSEEELVTQESSLQLEEINPQQVSSHQIEEDITEDGILCSILFSLTLTEAVRASVLSPRWRSLWTHLTKFNFDAVNVLDAHTLRGRSPSSAEAYKLTVGNTANFICSVDSLTQKLQGVRLDEFAVLYFLDKTHSAHLHAWIRFAFSSRPKTFRLHLFRPYSNSQIQPYDFPCQVLESSQSIQIFTLIFCTLKLPRKFDGLSHLTRLAFAEVDVSEEDLNCILSNSSSTLVKLGVFKAQQLVSICIPRPVSHLQYLRVEDCDQLKKIKIDAANLIKLVYNGVPVNLIFRQSSKLNDANICFTNGSHLHTLDFFLTKLSTTLPHLQSLTLKITGVSEVSSLPEVSSRLIHLTHLDLQWNADVEMSLLHLTSLMDGAPFLHEFKLCLWKHVEEQLPQTPNMSEEMLPKHPHKHLKRIEVGGFYFDSWQIEIAVYLLDNASELKSMTIQKARESSWLVTKEINETQLKNLCHKFPINVELVISNVSED